MLSACLWTLICLTTFRKAQADEEDPLQHVAQVAAREKHLNSILQLLEQASNDQGISENTDDLKIENEKACSHTVLDFEVTKKQLEQFSEGRNTALSLANLVNSLFLSLPRNDLPQMPYPYRVFYALVRASLESDTSLVSIGVAFNRAQMETEEDYKQELFGAYSYRRGNEVLVKNLATLFNHSYDDIREKGTQWFIHLSHRFLLRQINVTDSPTKTKSLAITKKEDGGWFRKPFFDCGASQQWVLAYSLPFFEKTEEEKTAKLKGVVLATFPLQKIDINQCEDPEDLLEHYVFGGTHKCDGISTKCMPQLGFGFTRGGYKCQCTSSHYLPNSEYQYFNGTDVERDFKIHKKVLEYYRCKRCPEGCPDCSSKGVCAVRYNAVARLVPISIQIVAICVCVLLTFFVFKLRKCKVIAASLWTMLEVILLGSVVTYCTVFLRYLEPTVLLCLMQPWVRELGFSLLYGAVVLKLYRTLVEHRTRKAHRYIIRDRDLLRYLAGLLIFVIGYLAAWAAFSGQLAMEGHALLERGKTRSGLAFNVCRSFWWEYITEAGELLFVAFGLYLSWQLCKAARDDKDVHELRERKGLTISLVLEFLASFTFYIGRHVMRLQAHPDHLFLAYFIRSHITVTISLICILLPKMVCVGSGKGQNGPRKTLSTPDGNHESRLFDASANGEIEAANLGQMHPEEIRLLQSELKRVYTQLQELKLKTMRKDNPHVPKRLGGRKPTHRRFSVQFSSKRHTPHKYVDAFEVENKTPEESVCSVEGPSVLSVYADGPSTYSEMGTPSLLHRAYKI